MISFSICTGDLSKSEDFTPDAMLVEIGYDAALLHALLLSSKHVASIGYKLEFSYLPSFESDFCSLFSPLPLLPSFDSDF